MHRRQVLLAAAALAAPAPAALAQAYPAKPIRFIMPYAPGGSSEILARPIAQELTRNLGQSVFIDFKPGGGTTIGADLVAKSAPDGYTLVMMLSAHAINATLMPKLPYDTVKDFAPITIAATLPLVVVVPAQSPIRSFQELIATARAKPGKLTFASAGPGNTSHLSVEYLKSQLGLDMIHVPYKGSGPAIVGLLGGEVDFMFDSLSSSLPQIKAGKFRALAMASARRSRILPEVPTVAESGVPGFEVLGWFAVLAPAGTPAAVVSLLNAEVNKMIVKPAYVQRFAGLGAEPLPSTPAETAAFIRAEQDKWGKIIKDVGIKAE